jgi:hypothetical protein
MHFLNKYQSGYVIVNLSYACNLFVIASVELHVSITTTQTTTSNGVVITQFKPRPLVGLDIEPSGFPSAGQFWHVSVYSQNQVSSSDNSSSALPNAILIVTVKIGDQIKTFNASLNELGQTEVPFFSTYEDISFQAYYDGNLSDITALSQNSDHYVRPDFVNLIYGSSIIMLGITGITEAVLASYRKRIRSLFIIIIGIVLSYSIIQLAISQYAQTTLWTQWGYSSTIFGFVRWEYLGYGSIIGMIIWAIMLGFAIVLRIDNSKIAVPLK